VLVTMKMRAGTAVRTDSIATVKFTGLMSQNFVSIDFGKPGSPLATPDFLIKTEEQPDLSAIMVKLDKVATGVKNLTDTFTGDKIENLLGPFTDFLKANKGPLTATIANLQSVSSQIASGQGTVGMLIYSNTLYTSALDTISNLQGTAEEIKSTIADAHKTVDQINSGNGTVGKLLKDEKLYAEISASATNLREILEKVNKGDGTVGKLINDQEFYKSAKMTMQKLDQATEGLEDQGPLSVLGLALGKLF
jgi:phospholipid/cholesterol/gamma-HCH transport system substrate-binding protein